MDPTNCYADVRRAEAYAKLEFAATYYLAYRDLPALFATYVSGRRALDFGCGTGRSSRFLKSCGFEVVGIDIAAEMIARARATDPAGDYRLLPSGDLRSLQGGAFDLVLSMFTFDNVPTVDQKLALFRGLGRALAPNGYLVSVVSSPEIYVHEWASFSTKAFPENTQARSGDRVRIVITDIDDDRPVEDTVCTDDTYRALYDEVGLEVVECRAPLGRDDEPYPWVSETRIAPWVIYILRNRA